MTVVLSAAGRGESGRGRGGPWARNGSVTELGGADQGGTPVAQADAEQGSARGRQRRREQSVRHGHAGDPSRGGPADHPKYRPAVRRGPLDAGRRAVTGAV